MHLNLNFRQKSNLSIFLLRFILILLVVIITGCNILPLQATFKCCFLFGDFAVGLQYYFQDPASFLMVDILKLHDNIVILLVVVLVFVLIMFTVCYKSSQPVLIKFSFIHAYV